MTTDAPTISVVKGDLFEADAHALVNTVNTVGIMGKGVALGFKQRFPDMYADYVERCERGEVKLGEPYLYRRLLPPWIINFPTKGHWRAQSRLRDIEAGLDYLAEHVEDWGIESLAVPPLGCGEGGLEWRVIGPLLYERLSRLDVPVLLFAPFNTPHRELQLEYLEGQLGGGQGDDSGQAPAPRVEPAAVALVEVISRLKSNPYQPPIGRIFFQKLAYFATERRLPTKLVFRRGSFGPYAPELKRLTNRQINNGLLEERKVGQRFDVRVGPTFERGKEAYDAALAKWEREIDAVVDLFSRMNTRQAEVAATVHFAAKQLWLRNQRRPIPEMLVFEEVEEWKKARRPPISTQEVASTIRNLAVLGWMSVEPSPELPVDADVDP